MNTFFLTATLAAAASTAAFAGQPAMTKANIDFPFQVQKTTLPAGSYDVMKENHTGVTKFFVRGAGQDSAVVLGYAARKSAPHKPNLTFRCAADACALTEISTRDGVTYKVAGPKSTSADKERLVTVYLDRTAGE